MNKKIKIAFYTLGCKVNQYDSQSMMDEARKRGYKIVSFTEKADFYIVNSCAVTDIAITKSRKKINKAKKINPGAKIILCGCWPQTERKNLPDIEIITGTKNKNKIIKLIEGFKKPTSKISEFNVCEKFEETKISEFLNRSKAVIKIQEGCRQFCSYCIIPYARGPLRSRDEKNTIDQIKRLVENGYNKFVLSGIHLGLYGVDLKNKTNLTKLMEKIIKIDGVKKIELSSIEINEVDKNLLKLIKSQSKIKKHLHIPLQSGSDKILKSMNRPYLTKKFITKIRNIKKEIPHIIITTDVIVGFPGETNSNFKETIKTCKKIGFDKIHVFSFSRKIGTPAYDMPNQVDRKTIKERSLELRKLSKKLESK